MDESPGFRVLIVDDEPVIRRFVERALRQPGYRTVAAANGFEAIALAATQGPFDLLLTDLAMPDICGDELARRLRLSDPNLKILYLTGYGDRLFENRSFLWEDEAFLEKPVTVQGLLEAVSLILCGHIAPPRAPRVPVPGARVSFAGANADLVTLSVSGALLYAPGAWPLGSQWPIVIEGGAQTVKLKGRVVSCEPVTPATALNGTCYALAIAFVQPGASALRALERLCQSGDMHLSIR